MTCNNFSEMKVGAIKAYTKLLDVNDMPEVWIELLNDPRASVNKIGESLKRGFEKYHKEFQRVEQMMCFERALYEENIELICGIDEVGRGPLAGPVVTAAVILPKNKTFEGINDSKKVSEKNRNRLAEEIKDVAICYAIGIASPEEIDEINILNATKLAMKRAVEQLTVKPEYLLIDAVKLADINIEQNAIIKGDEKSVSIAAASILAKVTRDAMMVVYSEEFSGYGFENNKGYGTPEHLEGLKKHGPISIHRTGFIKNLI